MARQRSTTIEVPKDIGSRQAVFAGKPGSLVYLIASEVNHPPDAERAVYRLLSHVHAATPLQKVFVTFDSAFRSGDIEGEFNPERYRSFPYQEANVQATLLLIDKGLLAAGLAFARTAQPACDAEIVDDWYAWAVSTDALDLLNTEEAQIRLAEQAVSEVGKGGADTLDPHNLFLLIRLAWDSQRWLRDGHRLKLRVHAANEGMASAIQRWLNLAERYYEANVTRMERLCERVADWLRENKGGTVAVILGLPWMHVAQQRLRAVGIGHVLLVPAGVGPRPAIEDVSAILAQQLWVGHQDMFLGEPMRERVEYAKDRAAYERSQRSRRWAAAGVSLAQEGRYTQAEECLERAREVDPSASHALLQSAWYAYQRLRYDQARRFSEQAAKLDPRDARAWSMLGLALEAAGQWRRGVRRVRRAIYLAPKDGDRWGILGDIYYRRGRPRPGCYCLRKGAALGNKEFQQPRTVRCGSRDAGPLSRPLLLFPPVIWLMRLILLRRVVAAGLGVVIALATVGLLWFFGVIGG